MKLILHLLQICLRNNEPAFWAKTSDEHQIHALLIDMDVLCAEFIPRLFRGAHPLCHGLQCRAAVTWERYSESLGIHIIDNTLRWVEQSE